MERKDGFYVIRENREKEKLLNFYRKVIWEVKDLAELKKKISELEIEIKEKVRFVGSQQYARRKALLKQLKAVLEEKLDQLVNKSKADTEKLVAKILEELRLDKLWRIFELREQISELKAEKNKEKEKKLQELKARYEEMRKTFNKYGLIVEVDVKARSVRVVRKEDQFRQIIFKKIEEMKKGENR